MSPATKILLTLLLVAGLGAGAYFAFDEAARPPAPPGAAEQELPPPPVEPAPDPGRATAPLAVEAPASAPHAREELARVAAPADAAQGIRGRVLLPGGAPAADCDVFLLAASQSDPVQIYLAHRTRRPVDPVARVVTGSDGRFQLGVARGGETFDVRVVSEDHPDLEHKSIRIADGDWYDAGDLRFERGAVVLGRVVAEAGGYPIAGATVFLSNPNLTYQMLPTPGRERGIAATTDQGGFFRFDNAPRSGFVSLVAEAAGYASTELPNQQIQAEQANEFRLELAIGVPLGGVVVDEHGRPVEGASINVTAQSAKLPQSTVAATDADGRFLVPELRAGAYRLAITARGYDEHVEPMAMTGEEVKIVLEQHSRVRLRVLSASGAPIESYTVGLKRFFPNNPANIGKVPEFLDVRVTPADCVDGYASIRNVPAGDFVFQIQEGRHAKTLSPPFTVASAEDPPVVEVRLTLGAAITGTVVDDRGRPVEGATVATDMNGGLATDTGLFEIFRQFMPDKHTATTTRTDPNGQFTLRRLAFADYMLRVSHPDFCEAAQLDISLDTEGQVKDAGSIRLVRGAVVEGICTLAGKPGGQIRVSISPPEGYRPDVDGQGRPRVMFTAQALTGNDGSYVFAKRVPPGTYRIHAWKEAGNNDVFGKIIAMRQTQRQLFVAAGQDRIVQNFDVPAQ